MRKPCAPFKAACVRAGLKAARWGNHLLGAPLKAHAKVATLNCVCTCCRALTHGGKATFLGCLGLLPPPQWLHGPFVKRINAHALHAAATCPEKAAAARGPGHCGAPLCARFGYGLGPAPH